VGGGWWEQRCWKFGLCFLRDRQFILEVNVIKEEMNSGHRLSENFVKYIGILELIKELQAEVTMDYEQECMYGIVVQKR
jgi:hypothetical protein